MGKFIELNYNHKKLLDGLRNLKYKLVTVVIATGGDSNNQDCCCLQQGYLCRINQKMIKLVNRANKTIIYIPVQAITAVKIIENSSQDELKKEKRNERVNLPVEQKEKKKTKDNKEVDNRKRIYGYGRKIKIDLVKEASDLSITEMNITELSLSILTGGDNFIYYFHKDGMNKKSVELLVSPTAGEIERVVIGFAGRKAVIRGKGLLYINSEAREKREFKLLITENRSVLRIDSTDQTLLRYDKILVGIGEQEDKPFIISG